VYQRFLLHFYDSCLGCTVDSGLVTLLHVGCRCNTWNEQKLLILTNSHSERKDPVVGHIRTLLFWLHFSLGYVSETVDRQLLELTINLWMKQHNSHVRPTPMGLWCELSSCGLENSGLVFLSVYKLEHAVGLQYCCSVGTRHSLVSTGRF